MKSATVFWNTSKNTGTPKSPPLPLIPRDDPVPAVHQRGHGPVQEALPAGRKSAPTCVPPRPRSACAWAASTTTSTTWAAPRATTLSSKCSATSPSGTTSRKTPSVSPGPSSPEDLKLPKDRLYITVLQRDDDEAFELYGRKWLASRPSASSASDEKDNFWSYGRYRPLRTVLGNPCGPGRGHGLRPGLRHRQVRLRPLSWKSGTSCSPSTSSSPTAPASPCPARQHRHRHGPRTRRRRVPGRALQLTTADLFQDIHQLHGLGLAGVAATSDNARQRRGHGPARHRRPQPRRRPS